MPLLVLLGGARSGKSTLAQQLASATDAAVTLIATAEARDDEMVERIAAHRAARPSDWTTIEEPIELAGALSAVPPHACVIIDCLTLWVSNLVLAGWPSARIEEAASLVAGLAAERAGPTLVVSNEVGMGVVPASELGRAFRDVQGRVNTVFCDVADRSVLVFAGRALDLTPADDLIEMFGRA